MSASKFVDAAVPLISITADNKMEIGKQALEILAAIPKPIAVVGVAGQYRTGKSYLLNKVILDQNKGFAVGPTINPCTKGIWMWGRPLKAFTHEGKPVNMIVLDSEGLGAIDEDSGHDSRIFSLVMLLSSCFVYNSTGTIDESALENLSLIIDLTKNIQIKSRPVQDDTDLDELHYYMPSFIWVVRDFSLELTDRHHNPISSDEYFEEALVEQEGDSDQVEQKNRIRRILQNFFTDRHCFTMVRPVNDEEQLKNIESFGPDKLRPEFVEQATELRNQIIDAAKIKTLEKHVLSGEMLADLLKGYVGALNAHKVPVIENVWNYVAKNECQKAKEAAVRMYEEEMTSAFAKRWPLGKKALKDLNREYFELALKQFRQLNYGEIQRSYEEGLIFELKRMYQDYKYDNENEFETKFKKFMEGIYAERILPGLKNKVYKSFLDLENDMKFLEKEIRESNVEGPHKHLFVADFMARKLSEAFKTFSSQAKDEWDAAMTEERAGRRTAEAEAENLRQGAEKERKRAETKLAEATADLDDAQKKIRLVEESLGRIKTEKERTEGFYEQRMKEIAEETAAQIRELTVQRDQTTEERNQTRKEMVELQSQAHSEIALLKNQVQILEERKAALFASDKTREEEIDRLHHEFQTKMQETLDKHEAVLKERQTRIDHLNEELMDAEEKAISMEKTLAAKEGDWEIADKNAKRTIADFKAKLEQAGERIKALEKASSLKNAGTVSAEKLTEAKDRIAELEEQLRQRDLALRQSKQQLDKEIALGKQAMDNAQLKFDELRKKHEDLNADYERVISMSENDANDRQEDLVKQMAQIKEEHGREIQNLEAQVTILQMRLDEEGRRFAEDRAILEKEKADSEASSKAESLRFKLNQDKMEKTIKNLSTELETLRAGHLEELERQDEQARLAITELEETIDVLKKSQKSEIREILRKKEEDLKAIQSSYDEEKENLEAKWEEEKQKYIAKIGSLNRQAEGRVEDIRRDFEETLEAKDMELQALRESFSLTEQALRSENATKLQKINEITEQLRILKERYESYKAFEDNRMMESQKEYERELQKANMEREQLKRQLSEANNQAWETQNELNAAVSDLAKFKEAAVAEAKKLEGEVVALKAELDLWKSKAETSTQASLQQKTELEKQLVMIQQQAKFKGDMHDELKKKLDYEKGKSEERLRILRETAEKEKAATEQKYQDALRSLEQKLQEKRKQHKDTEAKLEIKMAELERMRTDFDQKVQALEEELLKKEAHTSEKIIRQKGKIRALKEGADRVRTECQAKAMEAVERSKQWELEVLDLKATIEQNAAIYADKQKYYEEKVEAKKKELDESQKKFDIIFSKFSKKKDQENYDGQNTQNQIIQSLTENHRVQLNELTAKYSLEIKALTEKSQKLERELRQVREAVAADTRAKLENYDFLESSVTELRESERILQQQIALIRQEKDAKIKQLEARYIQDTDKLKAKINSQEQLISELEKSNESSKFATQTEKNKLSNQIDTLKANLKSLREQLSESEEARDTLMRENERLRNQNRKDKMLANVSGANNKWGRGASFGMGKGMDAFDDSSLAGESRAREPKDLSKAFPDGDLSENDISTNKILGN